MFSARTTRVAAQRIARPQSIRTQFQRRFASSESTFTGAENNAFNRERQAVKDHAAATSGRKEIKADYWGSATVPCLIIASVNAKILWDEHWAHWDHMEPLEERPEYPYQNVRTKNFFWGDGEKLEREGQLPQEGVDLMISVELVLALLLHWTMEGVFGKTGG
ncbi:hypothetical protein BOTNAR_0262g00150 [Botryotinia narcissicola]|uniref:Uncharacterized protein n=1 Tax=Botryotinia narcissicola TaxID=278944 RepID=A0A4Z1HZG9_9HELO|nr:hypothetical protein BOTNAR_0262g00150 [Botryotinia narcissicola]